MESYRNTYRILVGRSEGKRPLGSHRHRLEDNIKMALTEIELEGILYSVAERIRASAGLL
jgi:hypothetical protein